MSKQGPGMHQEKDAKKDGAPDEANDEKKKRLDLSVAQVSGSAVAAVVAAKLASTLGVYGTILGAGVISVIATCGGSVFQHLFKRTGEQIRDVAVHAEPSKPARQPAPDRTRMGRTRMGRTRMDRTPVLTTAGGPVAPSYDEEFGAATTHGSRVRGWKRSGIAAALVFLVAMGGITTYELISDQDFSGTKGATTFGSVVRGDGGGKGEPATGTTPSQQPRTEQQREQDGSGGRTGTQSPGTGESTPDPTPTPSRSTGGDPTPTPTPTPTPSDATPTPPPTGTQSTGTGTGTEAGTDVGGQEAPPAE
ncbi:hypothetical protein ACFV9D_20035 [Streptomyces sp. NPDC059875]|uniref:hypothetical protein n=1 Tax=unclassified Streptomyces TaxID=2593676 RepID=UPI0036691680